MDYALAILNLEIQARIRNANGDVIDSVSNPPYECRNRNSYAGIVSTWDESLNKRACPTEAELAELTAELPTQRDPDVIQKTALALLLRNKIVNDGGNPEEVIAALPDEERAVAQEFLAEH